MPLPELRDIDKAERAKALKEISQTLNMAASARSAKTFGICLGEPLLQSACLILILKS